MSQGFFVGGCYYSRNYRSIAYPLSSYPSGGVFNKRPDYYHDYEKYMRDRKAEQQKQEQEESSQRFKNFFRGFLDLIQMIQIKNL